MTLTGLEYNQTYTTDVPAETTGDVTSAGVKMYDMQFASMAEDGKSFTTGSDGKAVFKVKLRDDDILVLNSLPRSASYQVQEERSDHVPEYNIVYANKSTETPAVFTETGHTPGGNDVAHLGSANKDPNTELETKVEFVDRFDGTVTIIFRNNRDISTLTGIAGIDYLIYALALAAVAAAAVIIVMRRREYAEEDIRAML